MSRPPVVVEPGRGARVGNVEFLARTADTPFFNLAIIVLEPGQGVSTHRHDAEDDSFLVLEGTLTVTLGEDAHKVEAGPGTFVLVPCDTPHAIVNTGATDVRFVNVHSPGGFDRRIGLGPLPCTLAPKQARRHTPCRYAAGLGRVVPGSECGSDPRGWASDRSRSTRSVPERHVRARRLPTGGVDASKGVPWLVEPERQDSGPCEGAILVGPGRGSAHGPCDACLANVATFCLGKPDLIRLSHRDPLPDRGTRDRLPLRGRDRPRRHGCLELRRAHPRSGLSHDWGGRRLRHLCLRTQASSVRA